MNQEHLIRTLESEWEPEQGFFWRVRQGVFSEADFQRALSKVSSIEGFENELIERRLVSLLWYIPIFMHWQKDRVLEKGGDGEAYAKAIAAMTNQVERLLGVP